MERGLRINPVKEVNNMRLKKKLNIIGQNIKGRAQETKGEVERRNNQPVKGTIDKIRGKINEAVSDIRNKTD